MSHSNSPKRNRSVHLSQRKSSVILNGRKIMQNIDSSSLRIQANNSDSNNSEVMSPTNQKDISLPRILLNSTPTNWSSNPKSSANKSLADRSFLNCDRSLTSLDSGSGFLDKTTSFMQQSYIMSKEDIESPKYRSSSVRRKTYTPVTLEKVVSNLPLDQTKPAKSRSESRPIGSNFSAFARKSEKSATLPGVMLSSIYKSYVKDLYKKHCFKNMIGATVAPFNNDKLYLLGGETMGSSSEFMSYCLIKKQWKSLKTKDGPNLNRVGHSMDPVKNFLLVFGGEVQTTENESVVKKLTNSTFVFYPVLKKWHEIPLKSEALEPRKNHATAVYENTLIVYGGVIQNGPLTSDIWIFNTNTFKWKKLNNVTSAVVMDHKISHHKMCAVFQPKTSLSTQPKKESQIKEGFYVFGGKDQKGRPKKTLKILAYEPKDNGLTWIVPSTSGEPPRARYMHTLTLCLEKNIIIVYGGKGSNVVSGHHMEALLGDMYLLLLQTMTWVKPNTTGYTLPTFRFEHTACIESKTLYIIGGSYSYNTSSSDEKEFDTFELDNLLDLLSSPLLKLEEGQASNKITSEPPQEPSILTITENIGHQRVLTVTNHLKKKYFNLKSKLSANESCEMDLKRSFRDDCLLLPSFREQKVYYNSLQKINY